MNWYEENIELDIGDIVHLLIILHREECNRLYNENYCRQLEQELEELK